MLLPERPKEKCLVARNRGSGWGNLTYSALDFEP